MRWSFNDWLDRQADRLFILPAVVILLAFSIFPLLISAYLAVSRFQLAAGGYQLRFIGWLNFKKLLLGGEQYHFLGVFAPVPWYGWLVLIIVVLPLGHSIARYASSGRVTLIGLVGRVVTAAAV